MELKDAQLKDQHIIFEQAYEGIVTSQNVTSILNLIRDGMQQWKPEANAGRASRLAIECLQNMVRHAYAGSTYVIIYHEEDRIMMCCRNLVSRQDKAALEANYNELATYDQAEYKRIYRQKLLHALLNERGGAGIGLFDMAYRMGKPPVYELTATDDSELYYYTITIDLTAK
jgi:hypothetical protein